jgi:hypothetical protein
VTVSDSVSPTSASGPISPGGPASAADAHAAVAAAVEFVAAHQCSDGSIPEAPGGKLDPWDHVECAMALDAGGRTAEAERAYRWLRDVQHDDGSFWAAYRDGTPHDRTKDANIGSYLAVGVWHHYMVTGGGRFLRELWPAVRGAIEFALELQAEHGGIYWARDERGGIWKDCLIAGSSSVRAAIVCGERIAGLLGEPQAARWRERRLRLDATLRGREGEFGWSWEPKARFAMDWYYPVLCGVIGGRDARRRLDSRRVRFVRPWLGCRCNDDRPWVTVAESCELAITLDAIDRAAAGKQLLAWQLGHQEPDGGLRMGTAPGWGAWPEHERPSWTAAVLVLAADALYDLSPGGGLFRSLQDA